MFRHIVLLTLDADAPTSALTNILEGLATLPDAIPEIAEYRFGTDEHLAEGNADIGIVADFDDRAAYEVYRDHPVHRAVITDRIVPVLGSRVAIQMQL
ncbi:MAG: Dabb family protein [Acidimicrobiales bacterium]